MMKTPMLWPLSAVLAASIMLPACAGQAKPHEDQGASAGKVIDASVETVNTTVENQTLEIKINNALNADPDIKDQAHINVTVFHGIVLLTGETPNAALKSKAVSIANRTAKQYRVRSELDVAKTSSLASRSKDTWITTKVKSALIGDEGLKGIKIKVVTENGVVYLLGQVSHKEARAAVKRAGAVPDVKHVVKVFDYND